MTPERYQRLGKLFEAVLHMHAGQRQDFLRRECSEDDALRREVEAMLTAREQASSFMEVPAAEVAAKQVLEAYERAGSFREAGVESTFGPRDVVANRRAFRVIGDGAKIGRYRILRLIGEGGMGSVFEAEQERPRRTVALKMIRPIFWPAAIQESLLRFEQEAQALARLQHPGIAQIYEAGTADKGFGPQPYFAMELIHGRKPSDYVSEHNLSTGERLELVAKIADAVHHAHQRGIIHRDLKPSNILVDETGQPKIVDFGVARVTDGGASSTVQTDAGRLVGTLAYMSPEQMSGDPLDIDTRADVYTLGVVLYELLAGRRPYNTGAKFHEAIKAIREEDPARLSAIDRAYRGDIE